MKSHPILFSAPMVNATLEGRKTQTRRVVKPQPEWINGEWEHIRFDRFGDEHHSCTTTIDAGPILKCPYRKPGERLWVRETHADEYIDVDEGRIVYRADMEARPYRADYAPPKILTPYYLESNHTPLAGKRDKGWTPSIFMPRWASRIELEIVDVRVERLNEISEWDAKKEGVERLNRIGSQWWKNYLKPNDPLFDSATATYSFQTLWESINGKDSFDNRFVWVIEYKVIKK